MNIAIKRSAALGDVLSTTPIVHRFRQRFPTARIVFHTYYTNVFDGNPHIDECNTNHKWDLTLDLDGAHENRRSINAVDAYMEKAFNDQGDENTDKSIIFNYPIQKPLFDKIATLHPNKSWDNRTMPNEWWDLVTTGLNKAGYKTVVLGTKIDYCPPEAFADTRDTLTLRGQASWIDVSDVFICGASGLMVLAAATNTPCVLPLTISTPERALPYRWGVLGGGFHFLQAQVPCFGCDVHTAPGATWVGCSSPFKGDAPDYECVRTIKAEDAIEIALGVAKQ